MSLTVLVLCALTFINTISFALVFRDKRLAVLGRDQDRTPEVLLFFLAVAFGSIGVFLSMQLFRHKTKKWYFQIGVPLLILQNAASVAILLQLLQP